MVHIFQMANDTVHNNNSLQVITKNNGNKWTQPKHIRFWFYMQWHKLIGKKPTTALLLYLFFWFVLKNSLAYFIFRYLNINGCCKVHINNQQYDFENVNTFCTKSHQIAQLWLFFSLCFAMLFICNGIFILVNWALNLVKQNDASYAYCALCLTIERKRLSSRSAREKKKHWKFRIVSRAQSF